MQINQTMDSQTTLHNSPSRASYEVMFVSILEENDRVLRGSTVWLIDGNQFHVLGRCFYVPGFSPRIDALGSVWMVANMYYFRYNAIKPANWAKFMECQVFPLTEPTST